MQTEWRALKFETSNWYTYVTYRIYFVDLDYENKTDMKMVKMSKTVTIANSETISNVMQIMQSGRISLMSHK